RCQFELRIVGQDVVKTLSVQTVGVGPRQVAGSHLLQQREHALAPVDRERRPITEHSALLGERLHLVLDAAVPIKHGSADIKDERLERSGLDRHALPPDAYLTGTL